MRVVHTGKRGDKPEVLSLKEEFFKDTTFDIELKTKVIFADDGRRDIIGQYIDFCQVVKQQQTIYNDKKVAIKEAIRICIENGNLAEYLTSHRKEVEDVMFTLLTQEEATKSYGDLRSMEGREEGRIEGLEEGQEKGHKEGLEALVKTLKAYCKDFDSLYKAVISNEIYSGLTEEEVRKYY